MVKEYELTILMLLRAPPLIALDVMTPAKASSHSWLNSFSGHLPDSCLKSNWGDCSLSIFFIDLAVKTSGN